jgi:hypothetical protein
MSPILTYRFGPEVHLLIIKSVLVAAKPLYKISPRLGTDSAADSHTAHCSS